MIHGFRLIRQNITHNSIEPYRGEKKRGKPQPFDCISWHFTKGPESCISLQSNIRLGWDSCRIDSLRLLMLLCLTPKCIVKLTFFVGWFSFPKTDHVTIPRRVFWSSLGIITWSHHLVYTDTGKKIDKRKRSIVVIFAIQFYDPQKKLKCGNYSSKFHYRNIVLSVLLQNLLHFGSLQLTMNQ